MKHVASDVKQGFTDNNTHHETTQGKIDDLHKKFDELSLGLVPLPGLRIHKSADSAASPNWVPQEDRCSDGKICRYRFLVNAVRLYAFAYTSSYA